LRLLIEFGFQSGLGQMSAGHWRCWLILVTGLDRSLRLCCRLSCLLRVFFILLALDLALLASHGLGRSVRGFCSGSGHVSLLSVDRSKPYDA
jgi:hypothetical protein